MISKKEVQEAITDLRSPGLREWLIHKHKMYLAEHEVEKIKRNIYILVDYITENDNTFHG